MKLLYGNLKILMILTLPVMFFASCSEDEIEPVAPTSGFAFDTNEMTVTFANTSENADSYTWNFGDGETSTEENPTHTYSKGGTYTVKLTAVSDNGHDLESKNVTVVWPGPAPIAEYSFEKDGLTVNFTNASENAVSYKWEFGNNYSSTDESPSHTYTAPGTYTVILTAIGEDGTEVEVSKEISVVPAPKTNFSFGADGLTVIFTNSSEYATSYKWDFGDGNTSTEEHPTHTFAAGGTYTIVLTATGEDGTEVEASEEVTVEEPGPMYNIVFVTDDDNDDEQILWLQGEGFIVTTYYNSSLSSAPQADIDMLNAAELVIIGRSVSSGDFDGDDKSAWNALTVPVILNSQWAARDNRLNWFDNDGNPDAHAPEVAELVRAQIQEPEDVVFEGVTIGGDNLLPWLTTPVNLIYLATATNGKVLAVSAPGNADSAEGGAMLFVRFETGTEFYTGAGDAPAGPRTYFGFGADEGGTSYYWQLSDEAKQVYLNEIYRMVEPAE